MGEDVIANIPSAEIKIETFAPTVLVRGVAAYYHAVRTYLPLKKDAPDGRPIQRSGEGRVVELKHIGGLHHEYVRMVA